MEFIFSTHRANVKIFSIQAQADACARSLLVAVCLRHVRFLSKIISQSEAKKVGLIYKERSSAHLFINTLYKVPDSTSASSRIVQISFKKYFGYSVKEKIRYERFRNMVSHLLSAYIPSVKWTEIIMLFGYYDYSHMSKDFKKFLSVTPQQFLKNSKNFCVPKVLPTIIFIILAALFM